MRKLVTRAAWTELGVSLAAGAARARCEPFRAEQPCPPPPGGIPQAANAAPTQRPTRSAGREERETVPGAGSGGLTPRRKRLSRKGYGTNRHSRPGEWDGAGHGFDRVNRTR